jgi:Tfp pilus assembly protein PilF
MHQSPGSNGESAGPPTAIIIHYFPKFSPDAIARIKGKLPDDPNYLPAGDERRKQNHGDGAIPLYRRALQINPVNAQVQTNWASCLLSLGQPAEAETHLRQAIAIEPEWAIAHCNLGIVHNDRGDLTAVRAAYEKAAACDPELAAARLHLGALLVSLGESSEAVKQLEKGANGHEI